MNIPRFAVNGISSLELMRDKGRQCIVSGHEILGENFSDGQRSFYDWQICNMKFGCCAKKLRDEAGTIVSGYILQNPHESNTTTVCKKIQQRCSDMTFL